MSDDRWQRMAELFQEAVELPAKDVDSFLQQACGEDLELERAVRALLEADREAGDFMRGSLYGGSVPRE